MIVSFQHILVKKSQNMILIINIIRTLQYHIYFLYFVNTCIHTSIMFFILMWIKNCYFGRLVPPRPHTPPPSHPCTHLSYLIYCIFPTPPYPPPPSLHTLILSYIVPYLRLGLFYCKMFSIEKIFSYSIFVAFFENAP